MDQKHETESHVISDDDGYTLTRYCQGEERLYPEARFSFRPVMPLGRSKVIERRKGLTAEQDLLLLCKSLAGRIVDWNLKDKDGEPVPRTAAGVLTVHPLLQQRMFAIVIFSSEGGDVDPLTARTQEQIDDINDPLASDEDESDLGVIEALQKN